MSGIEDIVIKKTKNGTVHVTAHITTTMEGDNACKHCSVQFLYKNDHYNRQSLKSVVGATGESVGCVLGSIAHGGLESYHEGEGFACTSCVGLVHKVIKGREAQSTLQDIHICTPICNHASNTNKRKASVDRTPVQTPRRKVRVTTSI